jgi:hypothetical protein
MGLQLIDWLARLKLEFEQRKPHDHPRRHRYLILKISAVKEWTPELSPHWDI